MDDQLRLVCINCHYSHGFKGTCKCGMCLADNQAYRAMKRKFEIEGFLVAANLLKEEYEIDRFKVPSREDADKLITMNAEQLKDSIEATFKPDH